MYIQMCWVGKKTSRAKDMNAKSVAESAITEDIVCLLLLKAKRKKNLVIMILECFAYLSTSRNISCLFPRVLGEERLVLLLGLDECFFEEVGIWMTLVSHSKRSREREGGTHFRYWRSE